MLQSRGIDFFGFFWNNYIVQYTICRDSGLFSQAGGLGFRWVNTITYKRKPD